MKPEKVIFRTWTTANERGTVDAIFPELPADVRGYQVTVYSHIGQHGGGDRHYFRDRTRPATFTEKEPLRKELERLGYVLEERKRITPAMDRARMAAARR